MRKFNTANQATRGFMTKKELVSLLQKFDDDMDVIVDGDENGWHNLEDVELFEEEDGIHFINLVSSNNLLQGFSMKDIEKFAYKDGYLCVQTFCTGEEMHLVSSVTKEQVAAALETLGCGAQLEDISMEHPIEIRLQTKENYRGCLIAGEVFGHNTSYPVAEAIVDGVEFSLEEINELQEMETDTDRIKALLERHGYQAQTNADHPDDIANDIS